MTPEPPRRPCEGNPCGPNAQCREVSNQRQCSCLPGFIGKPPACRPECVIHQECAPLLACLNNRCVDPCKGTCGINAECRVINHNPICSCIAGFTGDPFIRCTPAPVTKPTTVPQKEPAVIVPVTPPIQRPPIAGEPGRVTDTPINPIAITQTPLPQPEAILPQPPAQPPNPCVPDPCGANAVCRNYIDRHVCECSPGYFGNPEIGCGPECVLNTDCDGGLTCIRQKCVNPCPGSCAQTASCSVVNHNVICSCPNGLTGDPYSHCAVAPIAGTTPCKHLWFLIFSCDRLCVC